MPPRGPRPGQQRATLVAVVVSLLLHVPLALWFVDATWNRKAPPAPDSALQVRLAKKPPDAPPEPEPEPPDNDGQIVEIAPPENPERPEEADFLSEYDSTVDKQTQDLRHRNDRQVISDRFSPDDTYEVEQVDGLDTQQPALGAVSGRERFRKGDFSLFPSPVERWNFANRQGLDAPAPRSNRSSRQAGSPSNDWLPEIEKADRTALNSHETLFASWWNRVKQLVSFYADQTLANARPRVPLRRPNYELVLSGLIAPDGSLGALDVEQSCGIPEFDRAIKEAFQLAAPFPPPPDGAVEPDGYVHMRQFGFVISIGAARAEMSGIDPRHNVQFPGLQTVPR